MTVSQGTDFCARTSTAGLPTTVAATARPADLSQYTCLIRVSFPGFANPSLVATTTVNVLVLQTLVLRPQNYDFTRAQGTLATVASDPPQYTALQPIACTTSDYEQVTVPACTQPAGSLMLFLLLHVCLGACHSIVACVGLPAHAVQKLQQQLQDAATWYANLPVWCCTGCM